MRKDGGHGDVLIARVGAGELLGEMAVVDDSPRMASAVCRRETVLRVVPEDLFRARLAQADPFLRGLVRTLARNARRNAERA